MIAAINEMPVSIGICAWSQIFKSYKSGIMTNPDCGTGDDHGVLAVGYASDYYLVKNSWAATWGDNGYIKVGRNGDGKGICGV